MTTDLPCPLGFYQWGQNIQEYESKHQFHPLVRERQNTERRNGLLKEGARECWKVSAVGKESGNKRGPRGGGSKKRYSVKGQKKKKKKLVPYPSCRAVASRRSTIADNEVTLMFFCRESRQLPKVALSPGSRRCCFFCNGSTGLIKW